MTIGGPMHEMSIAQSLIDILRDEMLKHDAKTLRSVRLNVGQMTAIVPDALSFCFQVATDGTEMEGARLIMEIIPLVGHCSDCEEEFEIKDYAFLCPSCDSTKIKTIGGQDLSIVEIEVD
jgi:hydrogenase nickel incorporation protein HypA/HybF